MDKAYILITPAKNEADNILLVAKSVINQSITPVLWLIINDGSIDKTEQIINTLLTHSWIKAITLPPTPRDITFRYSYVCKFGFNYAMEYCRVKSINYKFIGLLDADTIIEKDYFKKLMAEFSKDDYLGIASGGIYYLDNKHLKLEFTLDKAPRGTGRLWLKDCFLYTCGYMIQPSPDTISNIKAKLGGWKCRQYTRIIAIQTRKTSSAEGLWKGYKINGWNLYYFNGGLILMIAKSLFLSIKKPYYLGLAFFYGYFTSMVKNENKIDDSEVRNYYRNLKIANLLSGYKIGYYELKRR